MQPSSNALTIGKGEALGKRRRRVRYSLSHSYRDLLPPQANGHPHKAALCGWASVGSPSAVADISGPASRARITGTQTCQLVWVCPHCSARIARQRHSEIEAVEAAARAAG